MIIKECAYFLKEPEHVNSYGNCNLLPVESKVETRFLYCECIPITKCPYKMYMAKRINRKELNNEIKKLVSKRY